MNERKPGDFPTKDASPLAKAGDPRNKPQKLSYDQAYSMLSNRVYEATAILEQLEGARLVIGNGHHMRGKIAEFATELLNERWCGPRQPRDS